MKTGEGKTLVACLAAYANSLTGNGVHVVSFPLLLLVHACEHNADRSVQREHAFAIVDEVDSILIDEARTPLIISGQGDKSTKLYSLADRFAKTLKPVTVVEMDDKADNDLLDGDYIIDEKAKTATLTKSGVKKAEKAFNV